MPSRTFFNLNDEKRKRIEKALIHEFSKGSFEEASITNIINEAKIPRGSFYQYFEDKKDAAKYLIEKFVLMDYEKMHQSLIDTNGDIFEASLKIYDYRTNDAILNFDLGLAKNILEELRKNNINVFEHKEILNNKISLTQFINKENLNLETDDDLYYFIRIVVAITRSVTMEVFSERLSKDKGRQTLEKEFEILKKGMKK